MATRTTIDKNREYLLESRISRIAKNLVQIQTKTDNTTPTEPEVIIIIIIKITETKTT